MNHKVSTALRVKHLWSFVPSGGTLPEKVWHRRLRFLLILTWLHAVIIALAGPGLGYSWELSVNALFREGAVIHTAAEGLIVAFFAALAGWREASRTFQATAIAFGLMSSSAILVHLSGGYIELHFHFFVMLTFLALLQDWVPYLLAIVYVALHHGVVGVLWPEVVYNHAAAFNAPWTWAGIHAFFVLWASVGSVIAWRFNEVASAERQRAEEALAHRAKELTRSNAELEQFAYVASHDLQEPLRMVASYTQLLAKRYRGKLDADADEFIAYAVDGATRMQRLINDLLTYSRVGRLGKPFELTDCQAVLDRTLADLRVTIEENGAVVTRDPLPTVRADATQLRQLFQNLIGNALKFRSGKPTEVHVGAERKDGTWLFSVRDNGIGIDPKQQDRIFVIFQRLHARDEYPGTGIGLAICRRIAERHGGRIWVESEPGKGSTFYFTVSDGGGPLA